GDGDEVDALAGGEPGLGLDHLLVGAVGPLGLDVVVGGGGPGPGGVGGEGAGDEDGAVVEDGGADVDGADEGALAAADQAHAQLAVERGVDCHGGAPWLRVWRYRRGAAGSPRPPLLCTTPAAAEPLPATWPGRGPFSGRPSAAQS